MKKQLIFYIVVSIILINIIPFTLFLFNFIGKQFYDNGKYHLALWWFEKINTNNSLYNQAATLYKQKQYMKALNIYTQMEKDFGILHNMGNTYFKIWDQHNDSQQKKYWEKSVASYKAALQFRYHEETQQNLDFVSKKLEEISKSHQKNETQSDINREQNNKESNWNLWNWEESYNWKEKGSDNNFQQWVNSEFSQEDQELLDTYLNYLQIQQKNNSSEFNKIYQHPDSSDIFDVFFSEPLYDNSILDSFEKKDW